MAKHVQFYRLSAAALAEILGENGELIVNLTNESLHVMNGVTPGGVELARADLDNVNEASTNAAGKMSAAQVTELNEASDNITVLQSSVVTIQSDLDTAEAAIDTLESQVATLISDLNTAEAAIVTNANAIAGLVDALEAPTGTRMLFQQTSAPAGWTKDTSSAFSASMLRFTTGAVSSGGSNNIGTTPLGNGTPTTGRYTNMHVLTEAQIPSHDHQRDYDELLFSVGAVTIRGMRGEGAGSATYNTRNTGGGEGHQHEIPVWDIKYVMCICAEKA